MRLERFGNVLKINDKWLDFATAHKNSNCMVSHLPDASKSFFCEHIVEDLTWYARGEIFGNGPDLHFSDDRLDDVFQLVCENLKYMLRDISLSQCPEAGALEVAWEDGVSGYLSKTCGSQIKYQVTLHNENCLQKADQLLLNPGLFCHLKPPSSSIICYEC